MSTVNTSSCENARRTRTAERHPHNPDKVFQPGDFEKLFKEILDDVRILMRGHRSGGFDYLSKPHETDPEIARGFDQKD